MDLGDVATWAGVASSVAVLVTLLFLVLQFRSNERANRHREAVEMLDRITHETFAHRRARMHAEIRKAAATDWAGFDDSPEDFEARSFAYYYELLGQLVDANLLDYHLTRDFLQFSVVSDWRAFAPLNAHLMARFRSRISEWSHFESLAKLIATDLADHEFPPEPAAAK